MDDIVWETVRDENGVRVSKARIPQRIMDQMPTTSRIASDIGFFEWLHDEMRHNFRAWRIGSLIAALLMLAGCVALRLA